MRRVQRTSDPIPQRWCITERPHATFVRIFALAQNFALANKIDAGMLMMNSELIGAGHEIPGLDKLQECRLA